MPPTSLANQDRSGPATFTFGDQQRPFYTLNTYSTDELAISRADPSKTNSAIPIVTFGLENRMRRQPPNDGLVALIFSQLAAMLAISQAEELSKRHTLSSTEAARTESDALKRAAALESCQLTWVPERRIYELKHPSLSKQQRPALVGTSGIALSPVQSPGILHITVSTSSEDRLTSRQPPTILVTTPALPNTTDEARLAATTRTSTLPLTDADEPLASLDMGSKSLSLSVASIITAMPSLYAIDSVVAAILAVAVSDEATNPVLADMPVYTNEKPLPPQPSPARFQGKLVATLAEREDAVQGETPLSRIKSTPAKPENRRRTFKFKFWARTKLKRGRKTNSKKIVVEEFDLERYGRYSPGSSRKGQKLPGVTRGALKTMFWLLDVLVRSLTALVKVMAWLMMNVTRCVTSDRF